MMFNKICNFFQKKTTWLYNNSLVLQRIDDVILPFILLTFVVSTFMSSDAIGFFAIIVMFLTIVKMFTKPNSKYEFQGFEIWLILYFMLVVVSLFGSTLFAQSLKGFCKTFIYIVFYFSTALYIKDNLKKIPVILGTIALCTMMEGLIGVFQSTLHLEAISTWQDTSNLNPEDVLSRVYGTLKPLNPNLYGGYLIGGLPIVLGGIFYFLNKHKINMAIFSCAASAAVIYAILQTGCRGAYLSMLIIFFACFVLSAKFFWNKYKQIYLFLIGSTVCLMTMVLIFVSSLRHRFISIFAMRSDSSNSFRFNVYHSSLEMFKDNWLLGIGVGNKNFREIYGLYMKTGFDALSAYNIYLETAVESGIFALIAFLGFLGTLTYKAIKAIYKLENKEHIIYLSACIIAIFGILFHGLVDTIYFRPQLQFIFWTYIAVICALLPQKTINKNN